MQTAGMEGVPQAGVQTTAAEEVTVVASATDAPGFAPTLGDDAAPVRPRTSATKDVARKVLTRRHLLSRLFAKQARMHFWSEARTGDCRLPIRLYGSRDSASSVETSATRIPEPTARTPSSSITVQNGQATASVSAPVSAASRARYSLIGLP